MWQYADENDDRPSKQKMPMLWSMCIPVLIHAIHTQILTTCGWAVQQCQVDLEFHRYVRPTEKPQLTDPKVEGFNDVWAHLKDPNPLLTLIIFTPYMVLVVSNSRKSWCEDRKALSGIDLGLHSLSISYSSRSSALSSPGFSSRGSTMWFDCQRFCRATLRPNLSLPLPLWEVVVDQIWCFRCGTSFGDTEEVGWRGSCHVVLWFWPEIHRATVYDSQVNSTWCQMINQTCQHQGRYNWCGSARILLLPGGAIAILSPCVWTLAAGSWMMAGWS